MKKYALVGTGGRAGMYIEAVGRTFRDSARMVAFCDTNHTRMRYANSLLEKAGAPPVPCFDAQQFETMIQETQPDTLIVTTIDRTHDDYIVRALHAGCDVITEKPMTIDETRALRILDAIEETGRQVRVTFNYRYAPHHSKVRELLMNGTIGDVFSVHFEWLLNTEHGADYFRRWHREKRNSGGLLVHKSTHHFDLMNFWLGSYPERVYAEGALRFYGRENAEKRGVSSFYPRAHGYAAAKDDPFALHMEESAQLKALYLDAEHEDSYFRDQSVFSDGITIEDTLSVLVKYQNQTQMTYSLNAYLPQEGLNVVFNGSRGRLEMKLVENSYVNGGGLREAEGSLDRCDITVYPMFAAPWKADFTLGEGGHGGGDNAMLADLFGEPGDDPLQRAADHRAGAMSILTGIAGNLSMQQQRPVNFREFELVRRLQGR
ncbi:Gfo/Idh/MocA family oxidoreductase [Cronobacter muytjensii]|uniref:Gfo/Idh/MocA family oxidoreductase n=1 Tax=Cronobacter muytjensii TaxID=413501 RepID=A0A2T7AYB6_9ENTR|nr:MULTISPECIES: Gfo/Idh/MocA family oxidoreductase [Cronobacter]EGT4338297.1 gfo/Idh/MocA family oxidoreductase [Cronobacter muytjensii]ELY4661804.1 Gfo/Idh/MocA family oxidoreductase [Cronobacter muytjensii]ELY4670626.1 Gfo/Idh/MocA family oxidoreductase [Cronobacter muytjensii]ELY6275518.1 Gfo/Idh/MocA family oxidoreductase [Cronobacter muytjensii]ELY6346373.1 Gfo/Idh/MocA family oxidoreductase [Cronobacter muytjensii]